MRFIYAEYNMYHNSVDITTLGGHILRIDCNVAEDGLWITDYSLLPMCFRCISNIQSA